MTKYLQLLPENPDDDEVLMNLDTARCAGTVKGPWYPSEYREHFPCIIGRSLIKLPNGEWLIVTELSMRKPSYRRVTATEAANWCIDKGLEVPDELASELSASCIGELPDQQQLAVGGADKLGDPTNEHTELISIGRDVAIDAAHFAICARKRKCELRNGKEFELFRRLATSPGRPVSVDTLIDEVWQGEPIERNTVQKTVSTLRKRLEGAGIKCIRIDGQTYRGHYVLIVD